jgi:hypothetical protein
MAKRFRPRIADPILACHLSALGIGSLVHQHSMVRIMAPNMNFGTALSSQSWG